MNIENTVIYELENGSAEDALKNTANGILEVLKNKYGKEYAVTADDFIEIGKTWTHEVKVRKGNKVGAAVSFKWENTQASVVALTVDNSSKLSAQITYITLLIFVAVGAYMGYNKIFPMHFLPGFKIAAGLGGLLFMIPGLIIVSVLKSLFLKKEKEENAKLVEEIITLIKK